MNRRRRAQVRRLLFCICSLLLVAGCGGVSVDPPDPVGLSSQERLVRGQGALRDFVSALNDRDEEAFAGAVDDRFADQLATVLDNADLLEAGEITAEYVDSVPGGLDDDEIARYGEDAWLATARLRYSLGVDQGAVRGHETALVLTPDGNGARIAGIGGHGLRSPLWLGTPIDVVRRNRVVVINAGKTPAHLFARYGERAIRDVTAALPDWRGPLIIEVPRDKSGLDRVLATDPETYANIAAVTTTADGSVVPGAPVHVYVNPQVFGTLKARGAQVVISHEATHVATDASFANMPIWLLEGFADYVALKNAGVPVQRAAAQAIRRMPRTACPTRCPPPTT